VIDMGARDKYDEAYFFYNEMMKMSGDEKELKYYFSALINAVNSIPDYLLDEAIDHFDLDIPDNSRSIRRAFNCAIKQSKDDKLIKFYDEWCFVKEEFEENDVLKYRHINIHRRSLKLVNGRYMVFNSPDPEKDVVMNYNNFFRNNEGWANGSVISTSELIEIREIDEVYDYDPHFKDITAEITQVLRGGGKNPDGLSIVFTSNYLEGESTVFDPICIIGLKLVAISEQFINHFHRIYSWIESL